MFIAECARLTIINRVRARAFTGAVRFCAIKRTSTRWSSLIARINDAHDFGCAGDMLDGGGLFLWTDLGYHTTITLWRRWRTWKRAPQRIMRTHVSVWSIPSFVVSVCIQSYPQGERARVSPSPFQPSSDMFIGGRVHERACEACCVCACTRPMDFCFLSLEHRISGMFWACALVWYVRVFVCVLEGHSLPSGVHSK